MGYTERAELYKKIEAARGRPLITYVTSIRVNASAEMAPDVLPHLIKQIIAVPKGETKVDLMVISAGGDPVVAGRIISLLRERFEEVGVLVPYVAYSATTILALGADEIIMHPFANLGPIDIQIVVPQQMPNGSIQARSYSTEDIRNYFTFALEDAGISDQEQLGKAFELLSKEIPPVTLGYAKQGVLFSQSLSRKLLARHMKDEKKIEAIVGALGQTYHHHGYPLGRQEAEELGLPIQRPPQDMEQWMWQFWEDVEQEMQCNTPFQPIEIVARSPEAAKTVLSPVKQINVPGNIPPEALSIFYNQAAQQMGYVMVQPLDYELFQATMESVRCRSEFRTKGKILAARMPDLSIAHSTVATAQGWSFLK